MAATLALRIGAKIPNIRYINARRVSPSNGEMRLCVYNATHLASAMEINKFISAALGLVRFFIPGFRSKGDASNINRPLFAANIKEIYEHEHPGKKDD